MHFSSPNNISETALAAVHLCSSVQCVCVCVGGGGWGFGVCVCVWCRGWGAKWVFAGMEVGVGGWACMCCGALTDKQRVVF